MKKPIIIIAIIVSLVVAGIVGKVVYDNVYTAKVQETLRDLGLNPEEYDIKPGASSDEIREMIMTQEIDKMLLSAGISPDEVDLSQLDFTGLTLEEIFALVSEEAIKQKTGQAAGDGKNQAYQKTTRTPSLSQYVCVADANVENRGYIVIHGAGGPDTGQATIKTAVSSDPHFGGFLYFTYDANQETLDTIATRFVSEYNAFIAQGFDGITIFGQSAGGVIASRAAHRLSTTMPIEIHTLASPLNGYKFGPAAEQISGQFTGLNKEIGLGIDAYTKPSSNITVFHHKTVEDEVLRSFCGSYASLCSPSVIQNNNVPGSLEYMYAGETHDSIAGAVITETLRCRK